MITIAMIVSVDDYDNLTVMMMIRIWMSPPLW